MRSKEKIARLREQAEKLRKQAEEEERAWHARIGKAVVELVRKDEDLNVLKAKIDEL